MKFDFSRCTRVNFGNSQLLWSEISNKYVLLDQQHIHLVDLFLKTATIEQFKVETSKIYDLDENHINSLWKDLNQLTKELNYSESSEISEDNELLEIPDCKISTTYGYKNVFIRVNYESAFIQNLIHPQISHLEIPHSRSNSINTFKIFQKSSHLYLLKNDELIGSYDINQFHFLQGRFTLEFINSIYNKVEHDWLATFHASSVSYNNQAIMLIGSSGSGKSTLSAILAAQGFNLLADDFSPMLAENQELYRYPNAISIKEGAFETINQLIPEFSELPIIKSLSKNIGSKYILPNTKQTSIDHFICNKIVLVKYDLDSNNSIQMVEPDHILNELIPDSWINPDPRCAELFMQWLSKIEYYVLQYCDNEYAIQEMRLLFDKSPS